MRNRLFGVIGSLLLVCAANATSILSTNGSTLLVNESTGAVAGSAVSSGTNYFNGSTPTVGATTTDGSGWDYAYFFQAGGSTSNVALVTAGCSSASSPCGSGWQADNASSSWVGFCNCVATDGATNAPAADGVQFTLGFDVPNSITPANAIIAFDLWVSVPSADVTVLVNNTPVQASALSGSPTTGSPILVTINNTTCPNCIIDGINQGIDIQYTDPGHTILDNFPTGTRVQFTEADDGSTSSPPPTSPEPGSIVLMVTGLGAIVAGARRRNKRS